MQVRQRKSRDLSPIRELMAKNMETLDNQVNYRFPLLISDSWKPAYEPVEDAEAAPNGHTDPEYTLDDIAEF